MSFDVSVITTNVSLFLFGAALTLGVTVASAAMGLFFGALLASVAFLPSRLARRLRSAFVAVVRGFPFIILLFVVHYGLPFAGIRVGALIVGTVALAIYSAVYYSEVIRGGVLAVSGGQYDAARVLGLSAWQAMLLVVGPQAARAILPPATNVTLSLLKDSAILSSITVPELTYEGLVVQGNTFAPFEVFAALSVLYWLLSIVIATIGKRAERSFDFPAGEGVRQSKLVASYLSLD